MCLEFVSESLQFFSEFYKVIDLAVKYNLQGIIFVGDRLRPPPEINDAETSMPQGDLALNKSSAAIRPPMLLNAKHGIENLRLNRLTRNIKDSANSTHRRREGASRSSSQN